MSYTLEQIDPTLRLEILPCRHHLDLPVIQAVHDLKPIILAGCDVRLFLNWAGQTSWRRVFEEEMQCLAQDAVGHLLLTTWIPLVVFRERFCLGGRGLQEAGTRALMDRLRETTRDWRTACVDTVELSGRLFDGRPG